MVADGDHDGEDVDALIVLTALGLSPAHRVLRCLFTNQQAARLASLKH